MTDHPPSPRFLAKYMPGFKCLTHFNLDTLTVNSSVDREPKLKMGVEEFHLQRITGGAQNRQDVGKIVMHRLGQHKPVVETGSPADQWPAIWRLPEPGDADAEQKLLGQTHPGVGWHLK